MVIAFTVTGATGVANRYLGMNTTKIPVDVTRMLANEFELIQETEGYPSDVQRRYAKGDLAWLGIFRRISTDR